MKLLTAEHIVPLDDFLPFSKPSIGKNEYAEMAECLNSGWITTGPRVKQFERMLSEYTGAPYIVAVSSATAGLFMVLKSLNLEPGDEVITTPLTFAATINTIVHAGGTPILADVDTDTYNLDISKMEEVISPRTRAIMPVHFAGLPVDLDPLYNLAERRGIRVIEDAAHAIGARYKGQRIGARGDIQVFSFHPNKNMTTGEGGAIALPDESLYKELQRLRFHGIDREAWARFGKMGEQLYDIAKPGYKFNMMDIQASLGIHQLPKLDGFNARRSELAQRYRDAFEDWPEFSIQKYPPYNFMHCWHLFAPLVLHGQGSRIDRNTLMAELKRRNIGSGLHYQCVHLFSYYRDHYGWKPGDFPNAEYISDRIISLPLYPNLSDSLQDKVIRNLRYIFDHA